MLCFYASSSLSLVATLATAETMASKQGNMASDVRRVKCARLVIQYWFSIFHLLSMLGLLSIFLFDRSAYTS